jgi:hypothetical protein
MKHTRHILPLGASSTVTRWETFEELGRERARRLERALTIAALEFWAAQQLATSLAQEAKGNSLEAKARTRLGLRALKIAGELRQNQPRARILIPFPKSRHEKQ